MAHSNPKANDPEIAAWFSSVDADNSGRITATELQTALISSNGRQFSESACKLMIGMFDHTGQDSIDINGFSSVIGYVTQWVEAFQGYDKDNSGFVDRNELNQALAIMGYKLSSHFVDIAYQKFREMGQGVPADSFIMACCLIQRLTDGFHKRDVSNEGIISISYDDFLSTVVQASIV